MDTWDVLGPILLTIMIVGGVWGFASKAIPNLVGYINILVLYIPVSLVLAGFIPDLISQKFKFSIVSIVGILAVTINRLLSSLVMYLIGEPSKLSASAATFGTDPEILKNIDVVFAKYRTTYSGCSVPGFEFFESTITPQSLVLLCSMYAFLMFDILVGDPSKNVTTLSVAFVILLAAQTAFNASNGCFDSGFFVFGSNPLMQGVGMIGSIIAISLLSAGIGYGIKSALPVDSVSGSGATQGNKSLLGSVVAPSNSSMIATKDVGISDQDQFVCDAYKNGELVTSTLVE